MNEKMIKKNAEVVANGCIRTATKLKTITINIGQLNHCHELTGVLESLENRSTLVFSKNYPNGIVYGKHSNGIVRIINDVVLTNGKYDIYSLEADELERLNFLSTACNIHSICTKKQLSELKPLLNVAEKTDARISMASKKNIIFISAELIDKIGSSGNDEKGPYVLIHNFDSTEWKLHIGDVFVVSNKTSAVGYGISNKDFFASYTINT